jgi:formyltetrahydrofolate synthetase
MIRQTEKDIILGKSQIKNPEKWKGGKESMSDKRVIFESEDEFDKFYDNNLTIFKHEKSVVRQILKAQGYIRKNPVEEAEELWQKWNNREFDATERVSLIIKFYEAIQYLKERQK